MSPTLIASRPRNAAKVDLEQEVLAWLADTDNARQAADAVQLVRETTELVVLGDGSRLLRHRFVVGEAEEQVIAIRWEWAE